MKNSNDLSNFLGTKELSLAEALKKINGTGKGIIFIVDEDEKLCGSLTDGDIRRWLIKTGEINVSVGEIMNKTPLSAQIGECDKGKKIISLYKINAVPLLNDFGKIKDIVFNETDNKIIQKKNFGDLGKNSVIIMAGGKGTRLYPYTKILPKPLIPIGEISILERILNEFRKYNMYDFYLTVNYRKDMIKAYLADQNCGCSISYIEEKDPLGTAGGIRLINKSFDLPLFVTNCDILINANYYDLYDYHIKSNNDITIVSALKNVNIPYGVLESEENGIIKSIKEKPSLSFLVNTGMYIINPECINLIPENTYFHMTDLTNKVLQNGGRVGTYPIGEDDFLDMGEFAEMRRMEEKISSKV